MKKNSVFLLLFLLLLSSCGGTSAAEPVPELLEPVSVRTDSAVVTRGDLISTRVYTGSLYPVSAELSFSVSGTIDSLLCYPGQTVKAGDVIMTLEQETISEKIQALRESIDRLNTEGSYSDRIIDLEIAYRETVLEQYEAQPGFDPNSRELLALSVEEARLQKKQEAETREAALKKYGEQLLELEEQLENSRLTAPFDGTVWFDAALTEGSRVQADKTVCYVADPEDIVFGLDSYLSASDLERYSYTVEINGTVWAAERIEIDTEELMKRAAAGADVFPTFRLSAAEGAAELPIGSAGILTLETLRLEDVLLIPVNAVYTDSSGSYVYVLSEAGERKKRYFTAGAKNTSFRAVTAGLEEGEVVYVPN